MTEVVQRTVRDGVALLTLNRPERLNAWTGEMGRAYFDLLEECASSEDVRVVVVTGAGRGFCAGADMQDLKALGEGDLDGVSMVADERPQSFPLSIEKPIIAAVNGACVAGGMEMLGGCDLRVAVPESYFGVMEPKRGLFAGGGTTVRLPRQIPYPAAMEFLLCADRVPAEQALAFGLLNAVVPADQLRDKAMEYAHRITANGPLAVRKTKESVLRGLAVDMKEAYRIESSIATEVFSSEDAKEGPTAFVEKRPPRWTGR